MKLDLYMDVYPGFDPKYACAMAICRHEKSATWHRLKFTVDIPDWMVQSVSKPDHIAEVGPVVEV